MHKMDQNNNNVYFQKKKQKYKIIFKGNKCK